MEFTEATIQGKCHYVQLKVFTGVGRGWNHPQRAVLQGKPFIVLPGGEAKRKKSSH